MHFAPAEFARDRAMPHAVDAWSGLRTLIRARLIVTVLALPVGLLFGGAGPSLLAWRVLVGALAAVGVLSALYQLGVRIGRGLTFQTVLQLVGDLALVTVLAAVSGGRGSQFALFFGVIVVTGGLLARVPGGMLTAGGAAIGFVLLPWLATVLAAPDAAVGAESATPLYATVAYLGVLGVLAGMLGERVHRTRADLERTARELDRVRVDNDTVLRHLTTGVLSVDAQGRVSFLNPAAEQLLGLRSLECRGQHVAGAFPQRLAPLRDLVLSTLETRTPRARVELEMTGASGRPLPIGLSANLLLHESRFTGLVAVFQDLSEVREMERRARRHETLAEIGALSARIAHELRNGLNPISGSVECLQRELKLEGENAVLMGLISRECARLNRFVTDLLNYSRERDLALEALSVDDELAELGELLGRHPRRPERVTVSVQAGEHDACVRGDREQLRQVWLNLAANAFEAMADGGRLVVRRRLVDGDRIVVEFEDTGAGITADDLPRVGQPFYTTKQGGTGLGLTIASRIVERHGGTLTLESTPGRGTTVRVGLPVDEAVIARAA
jgi:two-component system sensor histidine kinase PilS (NtrC family)